MGHFSNNVPHGIIQNMPVKVMEKARASVR